MRKNIDTLTKKIPQLSFERNKIFFQQVKDLYVSINELMQQKVITYNEDEIEKHTTYIINDTVVDYTKIGKNY